MKVCEITATATLTAVAIVLSIVESFIPSIGIPGIKLGLANIAILITLFAYGWKYALVVDLLRVFVVSLLRGNIFQVGFFMSLTGAMLSLLVMILLHLLIKKIHLITISVIGALFHIFGQVIIAIIFSETVGIIYYIPVLCLSAIATGIIVGLIASQCLKIPFLKNEAK